jgi:antirestriction protein ArdC
VVKIMEEGNAVAAAVGGRGAWQKSLQSDYKYARGGNIISLMMAGMRHGYTDPLWLTFKQAKDAGWHVRKNEHHTARGQYTRDETHPGFHR